VAAALSPLCFVVMPFGVKPDGRGALVGFDAGYERLIAPAVTDAGLTPLRADQEIVGGLIHSRYSSGWSSRTTPSPT
jgi:hypothetical protein